MMSDWKYEVVHDVHVSVCPPKGTHADMSGASRDVAQAQISDMSAHDWLPNSYLLDLYSPPFESGNQ